MSCYKMLLAECLMARLLCSCKEKKNLYLKETFKAFVNIYLYIINEFSMNFLLTFLNPCQYCPVRGAKCHV